MGAISTIFIVLSIICFVVGICLSHAGSTSGLGAIAGQDLELFKKMKDIGVTKILQIIMFISMVLLFVFGIILKFTS